MTKENIEEKIDEVVENEDEANEAVAAAAAAAAAKEEAEAAKAALPVVAAAAQVEAANQIKETQEHYKWLQTNLESAANSLSEMGKRQDALAQSIPGLLEAQETRLVGKVKELLTPPKPPQNETPEPPMADPKSAAPAGPPAAEKKPKKRVPRFI